MKKKIKGLFYYQKKKNQDKRVLELTLDQLTDYSGTQFEDKLIYSEAKYCISCTE